MNLANFKETNQDKSTSNSIAKYPKLLGTQKSSLGKTNK